MHFPASVVLAAPRNLLLAALPPAALAHLWPQLERVEVPLRHVLQHAGEPVGAVYFPESGWASMLATYESGQVAEVGIVGREGMVGLPVVLGGDRSSTMALVQGPGTMMRLSARAFKAELERNPALIKLLLRYVLAFQEQVTSTAGCNGHHLLDQRLARWLLIAHDRADGDEFPMTQDFVAMMLCVHRPGVTLAARLLQQKGLIRYSPGRITIIDRAGLEAAACECYAMVRQAFDRLLGHPVG